jgi:predicted dehydrogenase
VNSPIRVLLVGFGYAGSTFHAPLIQATAGFQWVGVVSSDPHKVHTSWPSAPVFETLDDAIDAVKPDLVVIATPNTTHHGLAAQALEKGCHVVVDKPFTITYEESRHLAALAAENGRMVSVFHNRRWDSDFLGLQAVLRQRLVGDWVAIESRFDRFRPVVRQRWRESAQPGAGLWYDLGPHLLDQAIQVAGEPDDILLDRATQRTGAVSDDWFHAVLRYGQRRIVLHAGLLAAQPGPRWVLHGTEGTWTKRDPDIQEADLKRGFGLHQESWGLDPNPGEWCRFHEDAVQAQSLDVPSGDYRQYYRGVRDYLWGASLRPPVTGHESVCVMKWLERYASVG